jgi:hypothetical protein
MTEYKNKYLKYKNKYVELKNMLGGADFTTPPRSRTQSEQQSTPPRGQQSASYTTPPRSYTPRGQQSSSTLNLPTRNIFNTPSNNSNQRGRRLNFDSPDERELPSPLNLDYEENNLPPTTNESIDYREWLIEDLIDTLAVQDLPVETRHDIEQEINRREEIERIRSEEQNNKRNQIREQMQRNAEEQKRKIESEKVNREEIARIEKLPYDEIKNYENKLNSELKSLLINPTPENINKAQQNINLLEIITKVLYNFSDKSICKVCNERQVNVFLNCGNGHVMCDVCYSNLTNSKCPFCRKPIINESKLVLFGGKRNLKKI